MQLSLVESVDYQNTGVPRTSFFVLVGGYSTKKAFRQCLALRNWILHFRELVKECILTMSSGISNELVHSVCLRIYFLFCMQERSEYYTVLLICWTYCLSILVVKLNILQRDWNLANWELSARTIAKIWIWKILHGGLLHCLAGTNCIQCSSLCLCHLLIR